MNKMKKIIQLNRKLYKSIVIGMILIMPAGVGIGMAFSNIPAGLLAGNLLGFILGIAYHTLHHNNTGGKLCNQC
jgi:hypothetical protein